MDVSLKRFAERERVLAGGLHYLGPATCMAILAIRVPALWSFIMVAVLALSVACKSSIYDKPLTVLDLGLISFYISSITSTVFAYDIVTALPQLQLRTLFLLLYLAFRLLETTALDVVTASALGMSIHCVESLVEFCHSYREWRGLQFDSLVDFRSLVTLTLHGEKPGNYAAIYIAALALGIFGLRGGTRWKRTKTVICLVSIGLSAVCVLLSFSRSLYLSATLCIVLATWGAVKWADFRKKAIIVCFATVLLITVVGVTYVRPVAIAISDTIHLGAQLSQRRSASGRLSINRTALHLVTQVSLFGAGLSNYALQVRRSGFTSPSLLTAHAFNTALEVTIEQGILGLATLIVILSGMTKIVIERFRTGQGKALLGACVALLVYSMTQTFVIADQPTALLLAVLCATAAQNGACNA